MKKVEEVIRKIDFKLLREQKKAVVHANSVRKTAGMFAGDKKAIDGIIHMIDAIQDAVVEDGVKTEVEVFGEEVDK